MSVHSALDVSVDLDANRAEGTVSFAIDSLFVDGELRLWETPDGWEGYVLEDDDYFYVNTVQGRQLRVGEQAVRDAIEAHIENPDAGGVGRFERRCAP